MKINATLSRYLAQNYVRNLLFLLLALMAVIYLFDTVELIRRASKRPDVPMGLVLQMGLLKLPEVGQVLFPFAILFSAMFTFWQLTKRSELIVVRAAGFSVWQFLAPIIGVAMVVGVLQMTIINPIGALLLSKYDQLQNEHLRGEDRQIAIFKEGLWLRQGTGSEPGYVILHAARISQPNWQLNNVAVLYFDEQDAFRKRVDAAVATLEPGNWVFRDVAVYHVPDDFGDEQDMAGAEDDTEYLPSYKLPTTLTISDVEESFSSPETMSFWHLPSHIQVLEQTGFDASRLRVYYHSLLAQPLMFAAMILLAATVSMRPPRFRGAGTLFAMGIFIGFVVFFMSSFLQALGASQQIPVLLAAWSPALVSFLLGLSVIMNLEDG